jgi:glycosyltransferase involved in cell wall biosynthesis
MSFVVAAPYRSVIDDHARVLAKLGLLGKYLVGTRRGTKDIPGELTYLNPLVGLFIEGIRRTFSTYKAEWMRTALHPVFGRWVAGDVQPGDHMISSYGYINYAFKKAKSGGGKIFVDACNSHPVSKWELIAEEHRLWNVNRPPYPPHWNRQARVSVELGDYFMCPSHFVRDSFLAKGFSQDRLLHLPYPVDLSIFQPRKELNIPAGPLRVVCTGAVSLRKGFPYLLEAMQLIRKERDAVLVLTDHIDASMKAILPKYADVPIEWTTTMAREHLSEHLKKCHVFCILSIEEGMVRTAMEAMACGLPVVLTPNTGTADLVVPGVNGEVVPIRDAAAAAKAIIACHERQFRDGPPAADDLHRQVSFATFSERFIAHLQRLGFAPN